MCIHCEAVKPEVVEAIKYLFNKLDSGDKKIICSDCGNTIDKEVLYDKLSIRVN